MTKPLIRDDLGKSVNHCAQLSSDSGNPGRKEIANQRARLVILFFVRTEIPWEYLPQELGWGSGIPSWRRLEAWQKGEVWKTVRERLLAPLAGCGQDRLVAHSRRLVLHPYFARWKNGS